jgi:hypothetical protein
MDTVKGDPIKSLPGYYSFRNRMVRAKFNVLELEFEAALPGVLEKARAARANNTEGTASIFDQFTEACVQKVVAALKELLQEFDEQAVH